MKITINNREYSVEATGLKNVAYRLTSGKLTLSGIRNQHQPDVISVLDRNQRTIGAFSESTGRELAEVR